MSKPPADFFNKDLALQYDQRNSRLSPISGCLHFLSTLVLNNLPPRSRILCVGAGTGAEILSLARSYPEWSFLALDPSEAMLEVCRERLKKEGLLNRCELVHGYIQDLPKEPKFDAVLSILVGHFVKREEKPDFFRQMQERLRDGGYFINAEISFDFDSIEFSSMLKNWESVQTMMGATPESLATLPKQMREFLSIMPPTQIEDLIRQSGISVPVRFFQALMICAWYGQKTKSK